LSPSPRPALSPYTTLFRSVVVGMRRRLVIAALVVLAPVAMGVDERCVVVLVLVIRRSVLELAEHAAGVVMRHVIVVVGVDDGGIDRKSRRLNCSHRTSSYA